MKKNIKWISIIIILLTILSLIVLIKMNKINNFDNLIYNFVSQSNKLNYSTPFFKGVTFFGSTLFIVSLCVISLVFLRKNKTGLIIGICIICTTLINLLIKLLMARSRPITNILETGYSFPSGHTMAAMSTYGIITYFLWNTNIKKKYKIISTFLLSFLIILIGISRIFLGVHYASDVIGGLLVSGCFLIIYINYINKKFIKKIN